MQIVIDIPNFAWIEDIKNFKSAVEEYTMGSEFDHAIRKALLHGTPLPEHHGRLIDEKDLSLMTVHMIDGMFVCDAPTIIEGSESE